MVGYAQTGGIITGKVIDSLSKEPIEYATITLTDKMTAKVVNGAITDTKGAFEIANLSAGTYKMTIEFIGYNKFTVAELNVPNGKTVFTGTILLASSTQTLKGVTVTSSAPIIENKIDKLVYNAANDITSQGGLALDVLKKVPQVTVDIDGNVELQGNSNIRFLINGKPSSVFGNSVADALSAIPASQIKSIEVITSPGAQYDAQGTGGIINIILKDNKMKGINASINLSAGTRLENGSANLNMRRNSFGVNLYFSGNAQLSSHTPATQNRTSADSAGNAQHLQQDGYTDFRRSGYQSGAGVDWNINKTNNLTASFSYNNFGKWGKGVTNIQEDSAGTMKVPIVRQSSSNFHNGSYDWSLNYKKVFKIEGQELNVLYSASFGNPRSDYDQIATYLGTRAPFAGSKSDNPGTDRETNISVDYSHPISKDFVLETGVKTVIENIISATDVDNLVPATNEYKIDNGQSYHLKYDRSIYAGYLSASFHASKYLKIKAGARYEHTITKIDFPNTDIPSYNSLVPSVIFSHDFKSSFIKLAYSRRIERPDYTDVNPFLNRADPYNLTTGNQKLLPELGNNFELGYNKSFGKGTNIYIAVIERINTQDHKQLTLFYPQYQAGDTVLTNVSVTTWQNTGTEYNTGVSASGSWNIKDKLSLRSNINIMHRYLATSIGSGNINAGLRVRLNLNATYQFPHNLMAEAFGNYNSASNSIQGRSPQNISYTIAFRKQFWDKNASIGCTATNLFNEYTRQVTTVTTGAYSSYNVRMVPYRSFGISFTYKFGKMEFRKGKEDDSFMNNQPVMGG